MNGNADGKRKWAGVFRVGRKVASVAGKIILGLAACAVLLVFFKTSTRAPAAKADSAVYYPNTCLGGWQNPQGASGQSDIPAGDTTASDFTINNSAFLASSVASQIFCGYFPVDDHANPPSRVTVTFNWSMGASQQQASSTVNQTSSSAGQFSSSQSASQSSQSSSGGSGGSLSSSSGLIIATSTGFVVATSSSDSSASAAASTTPSASSTASVQTIVPDPTQSTTTAPASAPAAVAATTTANATAAPVSTSAATTPAAAPATDNSASAASSSAPTSFLYKIIDALTAKALADSSGFSQNPFFQISYTTDGTNWTTAGTVSAGNFAGYSIVIPVSSWDDLKNLEIKIETLPTVASKPDVYLESIALNVSYNGAISDLVSQGVDAVNNAANAAADAINAIVQPNTPAVPPPPVMKWIKKMSFDFSASQIASVKNLPWYPSDFSKNAVKHPFDAKLSLQKSSDASSLVVSGTCNAPNYVVLIYRGPTDYINSPASFLYNAASPCDGNGKFSFDISKVSVSIPDGSYYLLVGSEGGAGTWVPISPIVPISINSNAVQVPVTEDATTTQ